jgi:hypothetical protein
LIRDVRVEMIQAAGEVPQIELRLLVSDHLTKFSFLARLYPK